VEIGCSGGGLAAALKALGKTMEIRAVYSVFDPSAYRNEGSKWYFPQENATYDEFVTSTCGSKTL
jgi:hypothetical protein